MSPELVVLVIVVFLSSQVTVYLNNYMNLACVRTFIDACDKYATFKAKMAEVNAKNFTNPRHHPPQQPAPAAAPVPAQRD